MHATLPTDDPKSQEYLPTRGTQDLQHTEETSSAAMSLPKRVVQRADGASEGLSERKPWISFSKLLLLISLAITTVATWFFFRDSITTWFAPEAAPTMSAASETKPASVFALGRLEPLGEVISVAGPSGSGDARIEELKVKVGDAVRRGEILAILDNHDRLERARQVAATRVDQSQSKLAQTRVEVRTTKAELRASLEARAAEVNNARVEFKRQEELIRKKATSQSQLDRVKLAYETALTAQREAESRLARYTGDEQESVDVQVAESDLKVAEATLDEARTQLDQAVIKAPIAGTILDVELRPGERASQATVLKMGHMETMMARGEVYESDVAQISVGQAVLVHAEAFEQTLSGNVELIAAYVQGQSIVDADPAAHTDARIVEVLVRLDAQSTASAARFVGMQVRLEFLP